MGGGVSKTTNLDDNKHLVVPATVEAKDKKLDLDKADDKVTNPVLDAADEKLCSKDSEESDDRILNQSQYDSDLLDRLDDDELDLLRYREALEREHRIRYNNNTYNEEGEYEYNNDDDDAQHRDEVDEDEDDVPDDATNASENRENWQMLTNSLEMDNEELLFNMMYFSESSAAGLGASIGSVIENAMNETVALHSENNTPYKLKPASIETLNELAPETLLSTEYEKLKKECGNENCTGDQTMTMIECSVCKEELELGETIVRLPVCKHSFHSECVLKWFKMQNWCPICRTPLSATNDDTKEKEIETSKDPIIINTNSGRKEEDSYKNNIISAGKGQQAIVSSNIDLPSKVSPRAVVSKDEVSRIVVPVHSYDERME